MDINDNFSQVREFVHIVKTSNRIYFKCFTFLNTQVSNTKPDTDTCLNRPSLSLSLNLLKQTSKFSHFIVTRTQ